MVRITPLNGLLPEAGVATRNQAGVFFRFYCGARVVQDSILNNQEVAILAALAAETINGCVCLMYVSGARDHFRRR